MTTQRFFNNPHFLTYARLLRRLHQLIREGADEMEEGELLPEQMDEPADHLAPEEVQCQTPFPPIFTHSPERPGKNNPALPTCRTSWRRCQTRATPGTMQGR